MADVTMPQLGETVTEGTITRWAKKVGDPVAADEVLFEVSTDKVDSEVPSPAAGVVSQILVQEGDTVDVGTRLAVISDSPPGESGSPQPTKAEPPPAEGPAPEPPPPEPQPPEPEPARAAPTAPPAGGDGSGKVLSPVVRRLIAEHDLDPATITGTGAGGRITRADVLAVVDGQPATASPAAAPAATAPTAPAQPPAPAPPRVQAAPTGPRDEVVPFSNIRRRTAEHMVRSKATSAHTLVVLEVDYDAVDRIRLAHKDEFRQQEGVALTYLPFVTRALVDAIREFPHVNASVGDDELIVHHDVHMGYAVDLNLEGLIVPVVHNADAKRLRAIAREVADLAARARAKKLTADDIAGGTFTITNPGPFGTLVTAPIINQPQVAILSTDGVKKRPVVVTLADGTDAIAIHRVGNLAISFDHRAFDGAYASAFLAKVREILETRDWAQEL